MNLPASFTLRPRALRRTRLHHAMAALALLAAGAAQATTTLLFDPSAGVPLNPWLVCTSVNGPACSTDATGLVVPIAGTGGYIGVSSHPALLALVAGLPPVNAAFPVLDRSVGFRVSFHLTLPDEQHLRAERAGVSITVVTSDRQAIELGFQHALLDAGTLALTPDAGVFAQNDGSGAAPIFTRGERGGTDAATLAALTDGARWMLDVQGNSYTLWREGAAAPVLQGALRDYSAATGAGTNAYRTPNFLFIGDNTTSATAAWTLDAVEISTPIPSAVPEPAAAWLLAGGLAMLGWAARRPRAGG